MPKPRQLNLSLFDNKLLDGLDFCRKVYDLFDQVAAGPDGAANLRLRPTKREKRLLEELIPIARYVQSRYREGRRIKVRWLSGSQPYDAILWSSGGLVAHRMAPKKLYVEVTTAVHQNTHLSREQLHKQGMTWGVKEIRRDKKTREIQSAPYVYSNYERGTDLAAQIIERLNNKCAKSYPLGTVLIICCCPDCSILDDEWNHAVELVRKTQLYLGFSEVFLIELMRSYSATLYGDRKQVRRNLKGQSV